MLTPRTVACVIPQEFHGINTDVTVTESSTVRLRSRLSNPLFLYSSLKRFPVSMMDRYWSAVQVLKKKSGGDGGAYSTFRFTDETDENVGNATDHTACRHDTTETHGAYNEPNGIHHASHSPGGDERIDFGLSGR